MFAIVPKAIKAKITPQRMVMVCQSRRQMRCHQEEGEDTGCSGTDAIAASFLNRLSLFLTPPAENMTTHCYDLERRDTSLLVKADMKEHIEETLRQFCQKGKNLLLRLLECVYRSSVLDLFQCVCANALKPDLVLGLIFM